MVAKMKNMAPVQNLPTESTIGVVFGIAIFAKIFAIARKNAASNINRSPTLGVDSVTLFVETTYVARMISTKNNQNCFASRSLSMIKARIAVSDVVITCPSVAKVPLD